MSDDEIYAALREIFADVFLRDDIVLSPNLTADDVDGWDSFKQVEIIMSCQERFGIKLSTREIDGLRSLEDLVAVLKAKES